MTKRTFGGTSRKRKRVSGFRVRMRTHTGRSVIRSRRKKGINRRGKEENKGIEKLKLEVEIGLRE